MQQENIEGFLIMGRDDKIVGLKDGLTTGGGSGEKAVLTGPQSLSSAGGWVRGEKQLSPRGGSGNGRDRSREIQMGELDRA